MTDLPPDDNWLREGFNQEFVDKSLDRVVKAQKKIKERLKNPTPSKDFEEKEK